MKTLLASLLILFYSCNNSHPSIVTNNDTLFIQKDSILGTQQSIFFDENKNSEAYGKISLFEMDEFDSEMYSNSLFQLHEDRISLKKERPKIPVIKWVSLYKYQGKYYLYKPCDLGSNYKVSINDSTLIDWTMEGPIANQINGQSQSAPNVYQFQLNGDRFPPLTIYVIDSSRGIAVFQKESLDHSKNYVLMLDAKKINGFPIIVNNCIQHKQMELKFDNIDFEQILKTKRLD